MGNKITWNPGEEAVVSFVQQTDVHSQLAGEYDRFTYVPERLPKLNDEPLRYNETLVLYWFDVHHNDRKMGIWTDRRHQKDATWQEDEKQRDAARNSWVEEKIAERVRNNAKSIGDYSGGESDIGALTTAELNSMSDDKIFEVVFGDGVPDIFRWRLDSKIGLDPEFVEVKNRDGMTESQEEWFEVFSDVFKGCLATVRNP